MEEKLKNLILSSVKFPSHPETLAVWRTKRMAVDGKQIARYRVDVTGLRDTREAATALAALKSDMKGMQFEHEGYRFEAVPITFDGVNSGRFWAHINVVSLGKMETEND